jgi:cell division protein FtsZ
VFDDDFFRPSRSRDEANIEEPKVPERYRETAHVSSVARVQSEDSWSGKGELTVADPVIRAAAFGGTVAAPVEQAEPDELDIPAFLRRSN